MNNQQELLEQKLIACTNAAFDCGAWDSEDLDSYEPLREKAELARKNFLEFVRQNYATPPAPADGDRRDAWLPIATAPEATYVLVWLPNYGVQIATKTTTPHSLDWWTRDAEPDHRCFPTHWMPLPKPPTISQQSSGKSEARSDWLTQSSGKDG